MFVYFCYWFRQKVHRRVLSEKNVIQQRNKKRKRTKLHRENDEYHHRNIHKIKRK